MVSSRLLKWCLALATVLAAAVVWIERSDGTRASVPSSGEFYSEALRISILKKQAADYGKKLEEDTLYVALPEGRFEWPGQTFGLRIVVLDTARLDLQITEDRELCLLQFEEPLEVRERIYRMPVYTRCGRFPPKPDQQVSLAGGVIVIEFSRRFFAWRGRVVSGFIS